LMGWRFSSHFEDEKCVLGKPLGNWLLWRSARG